VLVCSREIGGARFGSGARRIGEETGEKFGGRIRTRTKREKRDVGRHFPRGQSLCDVHGGDDRVQV
jgi:hypothetical protein